MIVEPDPDAESERTTRRLYADDRRAAGFVYAHTRAMAINPGAYEAFEALVHAIVESIGLRTYELATLGAARAIPSPHCLLAHSQKSLRAGVLSEDDLLHIALREFGRLEPADEAVVRYAERISTDAAAMGDGDGLSLRAHGFTDRQIVDITLAAAARNYFSRALQALDVPVEAVPGLSPRLAAALSTP